MRRRAPLLLACSIASELILHVCSDGPPCCRWEEVRALRQLRFDYAERMAPLALARSLASELELVPARDVLLALYGVPLARPTYISPLGSPLVCDKICSWTTVDDQVKLSMCMHLICCVLDLRAAKHFVDYNQNPSYGQFVALTQLRR